MTTTGGTTGGTTEGAKKVAKMDAEGAGNAALEYINRAFSNPKVAQLGLEEVVPCGNQQWRVTVGFTYPWHQQEQRGTSAPRIYKDIIIKDAGKGASSVISMTGRPLYASKSVCKVPVQDACTAGQSKQPGCAAPAPFSWGDSWRTLNRAFVGPIQSAMGWGSFIALIVEALYKNLTGLSAAVLGCAVIIGLFAEGLRQQRQAPQRPNSKKCSCRSRKCRCRRLRRKRIESAGQASPS